MSQVDVEPGRVELPRAVEYDIVGRSFGRVVELESLAPEQLEELHASLLAYRESVDSAVESALIAVEMRLSEPQIAMLEAEVA